MSGFWIGVGLVILGLAIDNGLIAIAEAIVRRQK